MIKVVATIGLSVALPPAAFLLFGDSPISQAPGLAPEPVKVFHPFGAAVTLDQIIIYACLLVIVIAGTVVLRLTDVGPAGARDGRQRGADLVVWHQPGRGYR